MVTKRQIDLLYLVLNSPQNLNDLSKHFNVSTRTIRYDIDNILYDIGDIISIKSNIISIKINKEDLEEKIQNIPSLRYSYSIDEFRDILLYDILFYNNKFKLEYLINKYSISKMTVIKIIKNIKGYIKEYNLDIVKNSNKGYKLIGNEINIRRIMINLIRTSNFHSKLKDIDYLDKIDKKLRDFMNLNKSKFTDEVLIL